jgi:hypothetical protein
MEVQTGVQAVKDVKENSAQTPWNRMLNFSSQYDPLDISDKEKQNILVSKDVEEFCQNVYIRFEHALQQNFLSDIFFDDLKRLGDEEVTLGNSSQIILQVCAYFIHILGISIIYGFKT